MAKKIKLYGFNNLTKTLSFNIYDVCYARTKREKKDYLAYINEQYNSERLTGILCHVSKLIGAHVLNIARQDYTPQGASVVLLIAEESIKEMDPSSNNGESIVSLPVIHRESIRQRESLGQRDNVVGHLDKSHVTVHTYPESHPDNEVSTFRVDIDVGTCGTITPLTALDYLISSFDSDIITIDYRVRGFTRDLNGNKYYLDHDITSIQNFIDETILHKYDAIDINVYQSNYFHTKMMRNEIVLNDYLFNMDAYELSPDLRRDIRDKISREMIEIFYGMNVYGTNDKEYERESEED